MTEHTLLSTEGSDRATAYNMSSKLVRRGDRLLAAWLERPQSLGERARIVVGVCDPAADPAGRLLRADPVGDGIDNHCGPAIALDDNDRLHVICGAHHHDFTYRYSDEPDTPESWSEPQAVDGYCSYPTLACDADGTLHLAYREKADRWQLRYRRKRPGERWERPRALVQSPTPGYNHFMMSLSIGPTGTIHLTAQMYHSHTGDNADLAGRGIVYLSSADGGDTWDNEGDRVDGPGTIDTMNLVCRRESGISISNHVVDDDDQPWLFTRDPETTPVSVLWRRTGSGWEASDLRAAFDAGFHAMQAGSLSRDAAGTLHAVLGAHPGGGEVAWSDPGCELFRVPIGADGTVGRAAQVTPTVDGVPAWLPAVETWQWRRPEAVGQGGHWMLYTRGHNQSDQEGGCANVGATQVWVGRLPAV